ncbi:MAG: cobalamin biosynthesis protein [Nitrospirota bacterium]
MSIENKEGVRGQRSGVSKDKKTAIFYITNNGLKVARKIKNNFPEAELFKYDTKLFAGKWQTAKKIICIMAAGIVVRAVAPLIKNKKTDPAVVVLDEKGRFVISLLSGHLGGANELSKKIAVCLGAEAVITTASDVQGRLALDLWAKEKNLYVEDFEKLKKLSARIVNGKRIKVKIDGRVNIAAMPEEFIPNASIKEADAIISHRLIRSSALFLRPKSLCVGIGCNRGTSKEEIEKELKEVFIKEKLSYYSVRGLATIDIKRDEEGLVEFARENGFIIDLFTKVELNKAISAYHIKGSEAVKAATGAAAVAEPAALLSAKKVCGNIRLIKPKVKRGNVTLAIAEAEFTL